MLPQYLFTLNWADSGPGFSWPGAYYTTWVPSYERFVVTYSADSPEVWGYADIAIGQFGVKEALKDGSHRLIPRGRTATAGTRGLAYEFAFVGPVGARARRRCLASICRTQSFPGVLRIGSMDRFWLVRGRGRPDPTRRGPALAIPIADPAGPRRPAWILGRPARRLAGEHPAHVVAATEEPADVPEPSTLFRGMSTSKDGTTAQPRPGIAQSGQNRRVRPPAPCRCGPHR